MNRFSLRAALFTAGSASEQIKLWDIRAKRVVYELATGNNTVKGMAWDAQHTTLYAVTNCPYIDRMGRHHGYRKAKVPEREREEGDEEDDDDGGYGRNWPTRAYHAEGYFGYSFDAGDHRVCECTSRYSFWSTMFIPTVRYVFKEDPKPSIVPPWGFSKRGDPYKGW